jgi:hypothetical protein
MAEQVINQSHLFLYPTHNASADLVLILEPFLDVFKVGNFTWFNTDKNAAN